MVEIHLRKSDEVANLKGTGKDPRIRNLTWKQYWTETATERWPKLCRIELCEKVAYSGAHVKIKRKKSSTKYILPMCLDCNQAGERWMNVKCKSIAVKVDYTNQPLQTHNNYHNESQSIQQPHSIVNIPSDDGKNEVAESWCTII